MMTQMLSFIRPSPSAAAPDTAGGGADKGEEYNGGSMGIKAGGLPSSLSVGSSQITRRSITGTPARTASRRIASVNRYRHDCTETGKTASVRPATRLYNVAPTAAQRAAPAVADPVSTGRRDWRRSDSGETSHVGPDERDETEAH